MRVNNKIEMKNLLRKESIKDDNLLQSITVAKNKHKFEPLEDVLEQIVSQKDVKNRDVVVVAVAGPFSSGKSMSLDFMLYYLYARYINKNVSNWMNNDNKLPQFSIRNQSEQVAREIFIWPQAFLHDYPDGRKVAIILVDCQQTFGPESSAIFTLSTLLSSVQICNISQNIQENDWQKLQFFIEYGELANNGDEKSFQKLMFLVRDWNDMNETEFGFNGGKKVLQKDLETRIGQQEVRRHIREHFDEVSCFLMPQSDINDGNFKKNLQKLILHFLAPENLAVKKVNGENVKACDLLKYFKSYQTIFNVEISPNPITIFKATAGVYNQKIVENSVQVYQENLRKSRSKYFYQTEQTLEIIHNRAREEAEKCFYLTRKMGVREISEPFHKIFDEATKNEFNESKFENDGKIGKRIGSCFGDFFGAIGLKLLKYAILVGLVALLFYTAYRFVDLVIQVVWEELERILRGFFKQIFEDFIKAISFNLGDVFSKIGDGFAEVGNAFKICQ